MMTIDVGELELEVRKKGYLPVIHKMVRNYKPKNRGTIPMKNVIILSDEIPVNQRSKRLAPREKAAVDHQIDE